MALNRTVATPQGGRTQAGLDFRYRDPSRAPMATNQLMRAVVLNTYVSDDERYDSVYRVECDVLLVKSNVRLPRVQGSQPNHGVNDADLWIPRETTRNITTNAPLSFAPMSSVGTPTLPATSYTDLDGDHVLVGFIESDADKPIILRALSHPGTKRLIYGPRGEVAAQIGWQPGDQGSHRGKPARNEHYVGHRGTEFRINGKGDVLFDTVGATTDLVSETPSTDAGEFVIRMKDSRRFIVCDKEDVEILSVYRTGSGAYRIDLGQGGVDRVILGDAFMDFFNLHKHESGTGPTTEPIEPMTEALLSDIAYVQKSL